MCGFKTGFFNGVIETENYFIRKFSNFCIDQQNPVTVKDAFLTLYNF